MRILVAGATGAIGRQLVPLLLARGHAVVGMTRSQSRAAWLEQLGATSQVCDVYDQAAVQAAMATAPPDVVIHELTALPQQYAPRRRNLNEATDRIRREGTRNLIAAARTVNCPRVIAQSAAFLYQPERAGPLRTEADPPFIDAPEPFASTVAALLDLESQITGAEEINGAVLRYGWLYGPGTWYASDGYYAGEVRRRRYPIVGRGSGIWSFLHVKDAAAATASLAESRAEGIFNIVDDDPAPMRDWLPIYARTLVAPPPRRVPAFLARLVAGAIAAEMSVNMPGATNAKAKRELGWQPMFRSWRDGFAQDARAPTE